MAPHPRPLGKEVTKARRAAAPSSATTPRRTPSTPIAAAKAKTHLLQLLDQVERDRTPITITKRGRIVAQLVPAPPQTTASVFDQMYGRTEGWMETRGDIVSPDPESWGPQWL